MNDLANLSTTKASPQGRKMHLEHPGTGQPLYEMTKGEDGKESKVPMTITLLSQDSDAYKKAAKLAADRRLQQQIKRGTRAAKLTTDQLEGDALEVLIAATAGWDNIVYQGKPLEFTQANVRKLYAELPWVREQADAFISDRANFLGN